MKIGKGFSYASAIVCPNCGEEYLHHQAMDLYSRREDAAHGLTVHLSVDDQIRLETSQEGNPSLRRDGIRVWLYCENCPDRLALVIVQHKGCTYMYWE